MIYRQKPTADELAAMYIDAGWMTTADTEKMSRAIESGSEWFVARDDAGELLGLGRFITDYARYAFIVDVIVAEAHQREGVGTAIMDEIIATCQELGIDSVNLWQSKGEVPFYERFGFFALPSEQPHMKLKS